jgi:uncharacterized phage-associated protein
MTTKKKRYSAKEVAKYFIYLASQEIIGTNEEEKEVEGITHLKLQKILYLAQAYYLAKFKIPLFKEEMEAWKYGPVIPSIYKKYRKKGREAIISEEANDDKIKISKKDKEILRKFWEMFGGYTASRLVDIIHSHQPWKEAYSSPSQKISLDSIKKYYTPLFNK